MSDDARRAARGSVSLAVGQAIGRLAQLGFVLVVTRSVAPEEFGRYSLAAALLVFGGFIGDFGTTRLIVKSVSRDPSRADTILSGTLLASAALGFAGWAGVTAAAALLYGTTSSIDVAIVASSLPAAAAATSLLGASDGIGRFGSRSVATTLQTLIASVGGGVAVLVTSDVRTALFAVPLGSVAALVSAWLSARRAGLLRSPLIFDTLQVRWLLRNSVPFAMFAGLGAVSGRFDVVFLTVAEGRRAAAQYDVALRGIEALWYVHSLLTGPALFLLSRRIATRDRAATQRAYGEAVRLSYLVGLLVTALLVGMHQPIAELLGGADYPETATALGLMGVGTWLSFVALAQGTLLLASDQLRLALRVAASITVATILLDVILIPLMGIVGASIASVLASATTVVGFGWFAARAEGLRTAPPPLGALVAAAFAAFVSWRLEHHLAIAIPLGAVTFLAGLLVTRAVDAADIGRLRNALRVA